VLRVFDVAHGCVVGSEAGSGRTVPAETQAVNGQMAHESCRRSVDTPKSAQLGCVEISVRAAMAL
jgi:hypothetical protein